MFCFQQVGKYCIVGVNTRPIMNSTDLNLDEPMLKYVCCLCNSCVCMLQSGAHLITKDVPFTKSFSRQCKASLFGDWKEQIYGGGYKWGRVRKTLQILYGLTAMHGSSRTSLDIRLCYCAGSKSQLIRLLYMWVYSKSRSGRKWVKGLSMPL